MKEKINFAEKVAEYKAEYLRCNGFAHTGEITYVGGWVRGWAGFGCRLSRFLGAIENFKKRPSLADYEDQQKAARYVQLTEEIKVAKEHVKTLEREFNELHYEIKQKQLHKSTVQV